MFSCRRSRPALAAPCACLSTRWPTSWSNAAETSASSAPSASASAADCSACASWVTRSPPYRAPPLVSYSVSNSSTMDIDASLLLDHELFVIVDHVGDRGLGQLLAVLGRGQRRVGADAAVGEGAAIVLGVVEAAL